MLFDLGGMHYAVAPPLLLLLLLPGPLLSRPHQVSLLVTMLLLFQRYVVYFLIKLTGVLQPYMKVIGNVPQLNGVLGSIVKKQQFIS